MPYDDPDISNLDRLDFARYSGDTEAKKRKSIPPTMWPRVIPVPEPTPKSAALAAEAKPKTRLVPTERGRFVGTLLFALFAVALFWGLCWALTA